ncbi:MAG: low molecular weight protein arginine phosphatase [Lentisphaeria bacterium]|nr:low molecular weight protein arginine phosphatase [Lentisphaeria bacterium]
MKVLFVCTGNSCRSPMAELYFNHLVRKHNSAFSACSAGIYANDGAPISHAAHAVMKELGIETEAFSSTAFTPRRAQSYDLMVGMTRTHAAMMRHIVPELKERIRTLIPNEDVPDPFGGSVEDYKAVFNFMKPFIDQLFIELNNPNQGDK